MSEPSAIVMRTLKNCIYLLIMPFLLQCASEDNPPKISQDTKILVSESNITSNSSAGAVELEIKTTVDWSIINENDWIHFSSTSGEGTSSVEMSWDSNEEKEDRTGKVSFYTSDNRFQLTLTQKGNDLELVSFRGQGGTDALKSEKYLLFNKSVSLITLKDEEDDILIKSENIKTIENGFGFSFQDGKTEMGRKVSYSYKVEDKEGNTISGEVIVNNFSKEIVFKGKIVQHFEHLDSTIWVITENSNFTTEANKISILSKSFEPITEKQLANAPKELKYNSYNDQFYLIYSDTERIDIFDRNLKKTEEIQIDRDDFDIPGKPIISPISIAFNSSGKGIVFFTAKGNEQYVWRFIDSSNDHKISSAEKSENKYNSAKFIKSVPNFDHSKHYLIESGNYKTMKILNNKGKIEELEFSGGKNGNVIFGAVIPNKLNPHIYIGGMYNQFVYHPESKKTSHFSTTDHSVMADFSYLNESVIYSINNTTAEFRIFNYESGKALLTHPVHKPIIDFGDHIDFFTTIDGNHLILSTAIESKGKESSLIVFNKEMFFE